VNSALVSVETGAISNQAGVDVKGQVDDLLSSGMRNAARELAGLPGLGGGISVVVPPVAPGATSSGGLAENQAWVSPAIGMEFVWIQALNGWVGKYEVTNGEYRKFKANHNSGAIKGQNQDEDRQPVVMVNFADAMAFADWLTERDRERLSAGYRYRLPSDDEWMTFAQCGDGREYPGGNNWPPQSGHAGNYADAAAKGAFSYGGPAVAKAMASKTADMPTARLGISGRAMDDTGVFPPS
ncbi:MAG: SUMF1/EgtB/PvdO family nonheme iron enzyme, partial [Lentisphaerae bacterium]|nr:SUMF1/EgtB/PvdO family nonheme iron enzyme [Lentisphaerota bacterium]